jgi:hypothetical protein
MMAAERLGELRGLAIADAMGDLADRQPACRQQLGRALHPHRGEVLAERGVADLGVGALQLAARRGNAPGDVVERQIVAVLGLHDRDGIAEEARAMTNRGRSLNREFHGVYYGAVPMRG